MLKLDLEHAIATLVESLLPKNSGEKALGVRVSVKMALYSDMECEVHKEVQFLFQRKMNYTAVFIAMRDKARDPLNFELTSYHDSCWRTDGFSPLNKLTYLMERALAKEAGRPLESKDINQYVYIDSVKVLDKVEIEKGPEPYGPNSHILKNYNGII